MAVMQRDSLADVLNAIQTDQHMRDTIVHAGTLMARPATACTLVRDGHPIVVVTPTASGKSMCYHLPILQRLCEEPAARLLYLFPTKALAQDQKAELLELIGASALPLRSDTYETATRRRPSAAACVRRGISSSRTRTCCMPPQRQQRP
jgi:replicative superfamily II helicase